MTETRSSCNIRINPTLPGDKSRATYVPYLLQRVSGFSEKKKKKKHGVHYSPPFESMNSQGMREIPPYFEECEKRLSYPFAEDGDKSEDLSLVGKKMGVPA